MDLFPTQQDQKAQPSKINRKKRLNEEQVRVLERHFTINKKLDTELKVNLANHLGVPARQVAIWYQNKRARWKTQSLELEYNTIQVKLETALAENRRIEKDVKQLKEELRHAQEMLFAFTSNNNLKTVEANTTTTVLPCNNNNNYSSATSCVTEKAAGSSSRFSLLDEDYVQGDNRYHHHDQVMQIDDELFACFIGNGGSAAWG